MFIYVKIRKYERGLLFSNKEFVKVVEPGKFFLSNLLLKNKIEIADTRKLWLKHKELDQIVKSENFGNELGILDIKDNERAIVWVEKRFNTILAPGLYAYWKNFADVKVEIINTENIEFTHSERTAILRKKDSETMLEIQRIMPEEKGILYLEGKLIGLLESGLYTFWKTGKQVLIKRFSMLKQALEINGQEIMTNDRVTLRLNASITMRVTDPIKAATQVENYSQAIYRDAQLAIRAVVGTRDLDMLLAEKDGITKELEQIISAKAVNFGVEVSNFGIRDIILPGEMKEILNRVTEAKKAAEANLITRREETAGIRSQANTAKIIESNPVLMRLRELETLEKIAAKTNLTVVLGEEKLTERISKLI